jgi:hypothetical protein
VYGSGAAAPATGGENSTQLNAPANADPHPTFEKGSSSESRLKPIPDAGVNAPPPEPAPAAMPARQRIDSGSHTTLLQVQNSWQYTPTNFTQVAERPVRTVQAPSSNANAAPAAPAPAAPQPAAGDSVWRPSNR